MPRYSRNLLGAFSIERFPNSSPRIPESNLWGRHKALVLETPQMILKLTLIWELCIDPEADKFSGLPEISKTQLWQWLRFDQVLIYWGQQEIKKGSLQKELGNCQCQWNQVLTSTLCLFLLPSQSSTDCLDPIKQIFPNIHMKTSWSKTHQGRQISNTGNHPIRFNSTS